MTLDLKSIIAYNIGKASGGGGSYDQGYVDGKAVADAIVDGSITSYEGGNVTALKECAFHYCTKLTRAIIPNANEIPYRSFFGCVELKIADVYGAYITNQAFSGCASLVALVVRSNTVGRLISANVFDYTPFKQGTGYIYVPSALITGYKAATNWSAYASQFRALESYTVDGTTTGAFDESKI